MSSFVLLVSLSEKNNTLTRIVLFIYGLSCVINGLQLVLIEWIIFVNSERDNVCSCPPFECTCGKWNYQCSPKLAHSPPYAQKRLNLCAPAYCDIASGSGMQSLSIEIDTNKHLRHSNATLSHYQTESCFQAGYQNISMQNPLYFQPKHYDASYYTGQPCREVIPQGQMNKSCEKQDLNEMRRYSKRNRSTFETSTSGIDKLHDDSEFFDFSSKRIKPESPVPLPDCGRLSNDGNQQYQRNQHVSYDGQSSFFDDNIDLLSSPFETDMYSSLVQRFNETNTTGSEQPNCNVISTSAANMTEMKTSNSKDQLTRQKSCDNTAALFGSPTRNRSGDSATTVNDQTHVSTSSFPSHSQCMMPDSGAYGQSCLYDYDQRYPAQTPLTTQSNYCNHSINITLRYK